MEPVTHPRLLILSAAAGVLAGVLSGTAIARRDPEPPPVGATWVAQLRGDEPPAPGA